MLICDDIWNDTWFVTIPQRQKLLYLYLLSKSSKCGIFELNMRTINFDLFSDCERFKPYSLEEVLTFAGDRIRQINNTKAIIVSYIQMNWVRGKPLDPVKNPLHRGLQQELARYGLTFDTINQLEPYHKPKICVQEQLFSTPENTEEKEDNTIEQYDKLFDEFWTAYPSKCPRKVDKKKCREKYIKIISKDPSLHKSILSALESWKKCDLWTSDDGKYIKAPLVWLNNNNWEDNPKEASNANTRTGVKSADNAYRLGKEEYKF